MHKRYLNKLLCIITVFFIAAAKTYGQEKEIPKELYIATNIPDSLKADANSVVRYSMEYDVIKGPGKKTIKIHNLVTILNEKADDEAVMNLPYNKKYDSYSDIIMRVYDEKGLLIKKYHKSDMYDGSATSGEDLVTDERYLYLKHTISKYPETIEIEYEVATNSFINAGQWMYQDDEQSVQNAYCYVSVDHNEGFRYLNKNTKLKPLVNGVNGGDNYAWEVKNLKAVKLEDGAQPWRVSPSIYFSMNKFNCYGYPGDISTWQNFSSWQKALNADVCSLTPEREAEIRKMTDSIKTDKGKARYLYKYMQQNVRYVSVQLGIGGLKPFPATFVDQKKYGDCKALSNYMSALLKAVNIPSYFAIINAESNKEPADPSFPYNYFNHVILCVPFKNDTTWLECTVNTQPFGKLGSFTENRSALIVAENGGRLINTPKSTAVENQLNTETHLILDPDGGAKASIKLLSTGEIRDLFVDELPQINSDKQKEVLLRTFDIKQPSVFDFKSDKDADGIKEANLSLEFDKYCDVKAGNKMFYHPQVISFWDFTVPILEKRKTDYYFEYPMLGSDVTIIDLPVGFEVETLPVNQSLKFTYGSYDIKYVYDAVKNQVVCTAKYSLTNHVIPAAKYTELQQYLDAVIKAQNKKLVIRHKA